jgi:hypothetical protein
LARPESLTELLRVPSLRFVHFNFFSFTPALFQATANALMEGMAVTKLKFTECSVSDEASSAILANGLIRNTSVISISVQCFDPRALFDALAAALPSNSTLQHLKLDQHYIEGPDPLLPVFLALGQNTGLKTLTVDGFEMDGSLCTAMKDGLELNATLESLEFYIEVVLDQNIALWCRAFSFLRTNKTHKSLTIRLEVGQKECASTLRSDIVCMLQENASLESLSIICGSKIKVEEYRALVVALQHNTTRKYLNLDDKDFHLTDDEDKQMVSLLKKNYALERLPDIGLVGDVGAILRLNAAGRRYLVQDGSSISKGVEVLSAVSHDINCVFLHLLENPRLCDRSAVEAASNSTDNGGSTSPVNHTGMREHDRAQNEGKESRRRLT